MSGGAAGDLYLIVSIKPHPLFEREGDDLRVKVADAAVHGDARRRGAWCPRPRARNLALKVPPETANGQRIRLAGQGMPHLNGTGRGDLFAEITVQLPKNLTRARKRPLRRAGSPARWRSAA